MSERIMKSEYLIPKNELKEKLFGIIKNQKFELFIMFIIIANTITMCCEVDDQDPNQY